MKTRILSLVAALLLAGCGSFQSIDKDHNKQCKENCNVYDAAATPPPDVDVDVVVEPAPVVVQPAQPVVVEKQVVVEKPVYVEKPIYIEKPAAAPQTASINGYLNGKKHGRWVEALSNDPGTAEGPYINGRAHGHWVLKHADGRVEEGPYVGGKKHGKWVDRYVSGSVAEVPYVNGKQHGKVIFRSAAGSVTEIPYVDGKQHGTEVWRLAGGTVAETPYVNGKKHGMSISRYPNSDHVTEVSDSYKDGVHQWRIRRFANGGVEKITYSGTEPDTGDEKYSLDGDGDFFADLDAWDKTGKTQIIAVGSEPDIEDAKYSGEDGIDKWLDDYDAWLERKAMWEKQQDAALASGETDAGN